MTRESSPDVLEQTRRSNCPVCGSPTVSSLARLRLYLGATERCSCCMAGWKFSWSRWLYHVPVAATFLIVLGAYGVAGVALDDFAVIAAVALAALVAPLLLPIEARVGDRLTNHAIRRQTQREAEEDESADPS